MSPEEKEKVKEIKSIVDNQRIFLLSLGNHIGHDNIINLCLLVLFRIIIETDDPRKIMTDICDQLKEEIEGYIKNSKPLLNEVRDLKEKYVQYKESDDLSEETRDVFKEDLKEFLTRMVAFMDLKKDET